MPARPPLPGAGADKIICQQGQSAKVTIGKAQQKGASTSLPGSIACVATACAPNAGSTPPPEGSVTQPGGASGAGAARRGLRAARATSRRQFSARRSPRRLPTGGQASRKGYPPGKKPPGALPQGRAPGASFRDQRFPLRICAASSASHVRSENTRVMASCEPILRSAASEGSGRLANAEVLICFDLEMMP